MNCWRRQTERSRNRLGESGAAAVEFAIVLPLLLLILFGIVEFSLLMYDRIQIASATRELARYATVFSPADVENPTLPRRSYAQIVQYAINMYDATPHGDGNGVLNLGDLGVTSLGNRDLALTVLSMGGSGACPNVCDSTDCFADIGISFVHDYLLILPGAKALFPNANWGAITIRSRTKMRCE